MLANVGVTWYTWLEQARDVRASPSALDRIANALQLSPSDRTYFFTLAGRAPPQATAPTRIDPLLQMTLNAMNGVAALILDPCLDVLAFNALADALFRLDAATGPYARNQLWRAFADPERGTLWGHGWNRTQWSNFIRHAVGVFRARYALHIGEPRFEELIAALKSDSEEFCQLWAEHSTSALEPRHVQIRDHTVGKQQVVLARFALAEVPELSLFTVAPANQSATNAFRLLRARRRSSSLSRPSRAPR